jgi:hypothetical protein
MITTTGVSNTVESLYQLQDEIVSGVFAQPGELVILFKSGYSLSFNTTYGSFWLNSINDTKDMTDKIVQELQKKQNQLKQVLINVGVEQ